ncbi:MAG: hypothetical protein HZB43_04080 [candidate division Zixibacteria bacterium]|nr:hypothetical protein [candidate division Zixibacteria bacterium]
MSNARPVVRLTFVILGVAALILVSCSGRSTKPVDAGDPEFHELWPDEEAELMALLISEKTSAPRKLYDQISSDLGYIRKNWGDSIPIVKQLVFSPPFFAGHIEMGVDNNIFDSMQAGKYTNWDSLNQYFGLASIHFGGSSNAVFIQMTTRVNPRILVSAYRGLPGVRWIHSGWSGMDRSRLYAYLDSVGPSYLFREGWGDCPAGCIHSRYWYFRSENGAVSYQGEFRPSWDSVIPEPTWWSAASRCIELYHAATHWERKDSIPPTPITDLLAGNPTGNSITLSWTAPHDPGSTGGASRYDMRVSTSPIVDSNYKQAQAIYGIPTPGAPGSPEHFTFMRSGSNTKYYFAMKSMDYDRNTSAISNLAHATTLATSDWKIFDTSNSPLVSNRITALCAEPNGTIWCGTEAGISRYDGSGWSTYTSSNSILPSDSISTITLDREGTCWIVTGTGVVKFDGTDWYPINVDTNGLASSHVRCMAVDSAGGIWFGHDNGMVSCLSEGKWTHHQIYDGPDHFAPIWSMTCDKSGNVWLATDSGAFRFVGSVWTNPTAENSDLVNSRIRVMGADRSGVWFGFFHNWYYGVSLFTGSYWKLFSFMNSLFPDESINSTSVDHEGLIWFATPAGALRFDGANWILVQTPLSGAHSNNVTAIAFDYFGPIWFGTDAGICVFAPQATSTSAVIERLTATTMR